MIRLVPILLSRTCCNPANSFFSLVHKRSCSGKMRLAVVRCVESEDTLDLSFTYGDPDFGIRDRTYNFRRKQDEPLERVKLRIVASIGREFEKRLKKQKRKKIDPEPPATAVPDSVTVDVSNGADLLEDTVPCGRALSAGASLKIGGVAYTIVVNPPTIRSMSLPVSIMAGFPVYPRYEVEFFDKSSCTFAWSCSSNVVVPPTKSRTGSPPPETDGAATVKAGPKAVTEVLHAVTGWEPVGEGFCYVPSASDIGRKLRVSGMPGIAGPEGWSDTNVADSTVPVSAGPGLCPFDNRHQFTKNLTGPQSFRFVTYNILADLYADSDFSRDSLFPYCPPYALSIDYRKQLILKEIKGYNADIICLQEVDSKVFKHDLQPALQSEGISGVFNLKGGKVAEGLSCFYRTSKFRVIDAHCIILSDAFQSNPVLKEFMDVIDSNEALKARILARTTALQVVVLESLEQPNKLICVGNTHLYFRPDADAIRLLQAGACVRHLEHIAALEMSKNSNAEVSVILCGDFNSTPESGVYQFVTTQFIPDDHFAWNSNEQEAVTNFSPGHTLQMQSACGTPDYTNFTVGFVGCLDYIFADSVNLAVEQVVPVPSDEEVRQHTAIPSITMPSDHIALVCDLKWIKSTS